MSGVPRHLHPASDAEDESSAQQLQVSGADAEVGEEEQLALDLDGMGRQAALVGALDDVVGEEHSPYLPSVATLLSASPDGCRSALFTPLDMLRGTDYVVESLYKVLENRARSKPHRPTENYNDGWRCFFEPLHDESGAPVCMVYDAYKVRASKYIYVDDSGYLLLFLGVDKSARRLVFDRGHRFVLWAMYGPAPDGISRPVAMHTCDNPACLNPEHIVWGEDKENKRGGVWSKEECLTRLLEQRVGLDESVARAWLGLSPP